MKKRFISLLLCLVFMAGAAGCSAPETDYKIAMVADSDVINDNHLNQAVWEGLEEIKDEYKADVNFYRPGEASTEEFIAGTVTLIQNGYNVIVYPGPLFSETLKTACEQYPDCLFVGVDCEVDPIPSNAVLLTFDKGEAGFLAGLAAAAELKEGVFGGVMGKETPAGRELVSGFIQGVEYAGSLGSKASADKNNFIFADSDLDYPLGQQKAAALFDFNNVTCLLTAPCPTGLGAAAEGRARASADGSIWVVGSCSDMFAKLTYSDDPVLSAAITSAMADYSKGVFEVLRDLIDGDAKLPGSSRLFDLTNEAVGLPEENPNLSEETLSICEEAAEKILSGEIVISID